MDGSKFLIIGANGQLGRALQTQYPKAIAVDSDTLDITDKKSIENFDWSNINTVFNAAAYTNVDGAETPDGRAASWAINADAVANLVAVSAQHNITLFHISTDYVFDGSQEMHKENEGFSPLSVYGASKAAGDIVVSLAPKFYILRTSWVIGDGKNFVRTMLELGKKEIAPTVVSDQIGRLTFTSEIVRAIDYIVNHEVPFGTYNVTNSGDSASWADITREIFKIADYSLVVTDISTEAYFRGKTGIAPRPLKSTLSLDKIASVGFTSVNWRDDLKLYVEKELSS